MSPYSFPDLEEQIRQAINQVFALDARQFEIDLHFVCDAEAAKKSAGLLSSSVAIKIGRYLQRSPEQIIDSLLVVLNKESHSQWIRQNQYLNLILADDCQVLDQARWYDSKSERLVIAVWSQDQTSLLTHRLLSRALCQASALEGFGYQVWLRLNGKLQKFKAAKQYEFAEYKLSTALEFDHAAWVCAQSAKLDPRMHKLAKFVHLAPRAWSRSETLEYSDLWLMAAYFAGEIAAADLDCFVPCANERANLRWFLASSIKRISEVDCKHDQGPILDLYWRRQILNWKFNFANLAWRGDVVQGLASFETLLKNINALINDSRLSGQIKFSAENCAILSSANQVLSDTMGRWSIIKEIDPLNTIETD